MKSLLWLDEIDSRHASQVGGKAAHLAELAQIPGIAVPPGFCVTTDAALDAIGDEVLLALARFPAGARFAVRSSATAEDMPTASFAGQYETYLDVDRPRVLEHIARCRASLATERAVAYQEQHDIRLDAVRMGVVVQQMVLADVSGVLFTADPVNGNRRVASIDAIAGLGEALVSGRATPDVYNVRDGRVSSKRISGLRPTMTEAQAIRLVELGRKIEARFGRPQDIEWCLASDEFHFVQSRPITTLFPVPDAKDDAPRVYLSTGHQQMMTDAMKPLGISMWRLSGGADFHVAGGRLFVDVSRALASPASRAGLISFFRKGDPLWADAIQEIADRGFIPAQPDPDRPAWQPPAAGQAPPESDAAIVADLIRQADAGVEKTKRDIEGKTGPALFDAILADIGEKKGGLTDPRMQRALMAGIDATWTLNEKLEAWLGEKNAALTLAESAPNNVTSEMGLALLDVADDIRPHRAMVEALEAVVGHPGRNEGKPFDVGSPALSRWLERYGMRGPGEIDITRPRWSERPDLLAPALLANVRQFAPGESKRRFAHGLEQATKKEAEILRRLRALPDGDARAQEAKTLIDRLRTFVGYREYPKYSMIARFFVYKQTLMKEAARLVAAGVLDSPEDFFWLTFQELAEVSRTNVVDRAAIGRRQAEFAEYEKLTPPRVLTSEGESIVGSYQREVPPGALVGLGVSNGTVEGRARILLDFAEATLEAGDILVTKFTDPGWTPLFASATALVTEIGGLMTHGAVVAREYGLPAVVGVVDATRLIRDGQRIRVHGTEGYVEVLP